MHETIAVRRAVMGDVPTLAPLFESYCRFYRKEPGEGHAAVYLRDRMNNHDAVVFLAESLGDADAGHAEAVGFALLYAKWQSTGMRRDWTLNDLFVSPHARRRGVASALLASVESFALESGARKLQLKTHMTNTTAQALYLRQGWQRKEEFWTYEKRLRAE